jgi:hypothetical protein
MYQPLIFARVLSDDARCLRATFDSEGLERLADSLVDGVRRDPQLGRDFLRREVLVDQPQAVELALGQPSNALRNRIMRGIVIGVRHARPLL